jgi:hypothetical protein
MPMSGDSMASEIKSAVDAIIPAGGTPADLNYLKALAGAIVAHIKNNAVVNTNDTGTATGAVGGGGGVPVVATGVGTIS